MKVSVEGISRGLQQLGAEVAVKASLDRRVINIGRGAALLALNFGGRCGACAMGGGVEASVLVEAATVGATPPGDIGVFCPLVMVPEAPGDVGVHGDVCGCVVLVVVSTAGGEAGCGGM